MNPKHKKSRKTPVPFWLKALNTVKFGDTKRLDSLLLKSSYWATCACGEQDKRIPLIYDVAYAQKRPKDKILHDLGVYFNDDVSALRSYRTPEAFEIVRIEAINTLKKIERRAAIVLKKELAKSG